MTHSTRQLQYEHRHCILCGEQNPYGVKLRFSTNGQEVVSTFQLDERFQGYEGIAQGGIVAGVLDCAMVHCLFQQGVRALTARLQVRYRHPVPIGVTLTVSARVCESIRGGFALKARLFQGSLLLATAEGFFMPTARTDEPCS